MIIGYARVSTDDQNLDLQRDALVLAQCERIFEETAGGGSGEGRPALAEALSFARPGDTLVVWRLDRLGRSLSDLVALTNDLAQRGIQFVSVTERIETSTATGKLVFHVFAALAEFERNLIRERTRAGLTAARARGRLGGRPAADPAKVRAAVRMLREDRSMSAAKIAATFGIAESTLYKYARQSKGECNG